MRIENPFHSGELEAQRLAGESDTAVRNSVVIADTIIGGALPFLAQQHMVVLASRSAAGSVWASPIFGTPGFASSPDGRQVIFDRRQIWEAQSDPLWHNLNPGAGVGILAIELSTRRRLRVNGTVLHIDRDTFVVQVAEAYPNCPKYIQRRSLHLAGDPQFNSRESISGGPMSIEVAPLIETADTLFLASSHPDRGSDVSHRGGEAGFIQRLDARTIRVPDYAGNSLFNTFGNLLVDPRAGVTVMDFTLGRLVQLTGEATVEWSQTDERGQTGGTSRFWTYRIEAWRILPMPATARWLFLDASPFNPTTK